MSEFENEFNDYVQATDEDGNELLLEPLDYFFYNGEEYCVLAEVDEPVSEACEGCENTNCEGCEQYGAENEDEEPMNCFICKVQTVQDEDGNDVDEFIPVEDDALAAKLIEIANTRMEEDEEEE